MVSATQRSRSRPQGGETERPTVELRRLDRLVTRWLARNSITLLRISMALVFLGFGVLKFFPNLSPAQDLARETMHALTFGLIPDSLGRVFVAVLESTIGLSLLTGRFMRLGLALLAVAMVGILSPLVLFPGDLFSGQFHAPTLAGQYVLKDVVLLSSGLVIAARASGGRMVPPDK